MIPIRIGKNVPWVGRFSLVFMEITQHSGFDIYETYMHNVHNFDELKIWPHIISQNGLYKDVFWRTIENPQCTHILKANFSLKICNVHLKLALPISGSHLTNLINTEVRTLKCLFKM